MDYKKTWEELELWLTEGNEMQEYYRGKGDYYRVRLVDGYKNVAEKRKK